MWFLRRGRESNIFMLDQIGELVQAGESVEDVGVVAMVLRTVVVYVSALTLVRFASRRLLSRAGALDVLVAIMLGSILSRAVNGNAALLPTLAAGGVLLGMQWLLAFIAVHTRWMGTVVKGAPVPLIRDGKVLEKELRMTGLSREDLTEALRLEAHDEDPANVRRAYLERNGKISVIPYRRDDE